MSHSQRITNLLSVLCLAVGCAGSDAPPPVVGDRLPDGWDANALEALIGNLDVIKTVENEIDIEVLKWKVEENAQPQTVESALVWALFRAGEAQDWMLAHVIRATGPDGRLSPWSLAVWEGTPQVSHAYYDEAPGPDEVAQFLRATWWSDGATAGNRVVDSAVRAQAWERTIGAPPPEGR